MKKYNVHNSAGIENIEHLRNTESHEEEMTFKQRQTFLFQESGILIRSPYIEFYECPVYRDSWQPPEIS